MVFFGKLREVASSVAAALASLRFFLSELILSPERSGDKIGEKVPSRFEIREEVLKSPPTWFCSTPGWKWDWSGEAL